MTAQPAEPTTEGYDSRAEAAAPPLYDDAQQPQILQPGDVYSRDRLVAEYGSKSLALRTPEGVLTIKPDQYELTSTQAAGFKAIGIDVKNDPGVVDHIPAFLHMCSTRELDPVAQEAYLIGRGDGNNRKWTMQVGIGGYMKMVRRSGVFKRVAETLWTGREDDNTQWFRDDRGIMRRVWWDQWPESRGWPGAAKTIIEHYDPLTSELTETEGIADWGMYAPMFPAWEWGERRGQKVWLKNPDGSPKMALNDMWAKGNPFMLAKCSRALTCRLIVPDQVNGIYIHEEMHRADQEERARLAEAAKERRRAKFQITTARGIDVANASGGADTDAPDEDDTDSAPILPDAPEDTSSAPVQAGEAVRESVDALRKSAQDAPASAPSTAPSDAPQAASNAEGSASSDAPTSAPTSAHAAARYTDEDRAALLLAELEWQAERLGQPSASALARRNIAALRKNLDRFTAPELLPIVAGFRPMVCARLEQAGETDAARRYAAVSPQDVVRVDDLLGIVDAEVLPEDDARLDADPERPHAFVNDQGVCGVCSRFEDDVIHA